MAFDLSKQAVNYRYIDELYKKLDDLAVPDRSLSITSQGSYSEYTLYPLVPKAK